MPRVRLRSLQRSDRPWRGADSERLRAQLGLQRSTVAADNLIVEAADETVVSAHNHVSADITDFASTTDGRIDAAVGVTVQAKLTPGAAVTDATGGATVDDEARAAINTLLARLRTMGLIDP